MSGTSLDGLDLVYCKIKIGKKSKKFEILSATTKKYTSDWKSKLSSAHTLTAAQLFSLDHLYGQYLGKVTLDFAKENKIKDIREIIGSLKK